ncbi:MAG TPA: VOC family protein [Vicinamibacterales bacterium]|nr:VOC family protein [Vicinamibacterales bacterium]
MERTGPHREYGIAPSGHQLPDATRLGKVSLQVSDLDRSIAYYRDLLGLRVLDQDRTVARLAIPQANDHLIELRYERGTRPVARGETLGLYHFAILLPSRAALGQFVRHLASANVPFGAADHLVSEAIYLWDPDGLGIEVYADRPREAWRTRGRELVMTTDRLDLHSVMDAAGSGTWNGMPAETTMGHMHLSVSDLNAARSFYHEGLGLATTVWSYPGALFMSAGGYHHHLGTNRWAMGARPPVESDARLLAWELVLPSRADIAAAAASVRAAGYDARDDIVIDPWGTALVLKAASEACWAPAT